MRTEPRDEGISLLVPSGAAVPCLALLLACSPEAAPVPGTSQPLAELVEETGSRRITRPWLSPFPDHEACRKAAAPAPAPPTGYCGGPLLSRLDAPPRPEGPTTRGNPGGGDPPPRPDELHAHGLRELVAGRPSRAVPFLERARSLDAADWQVANDLAVGHLLHGLSEDRVDLLDALRVLDAAVAGEPDAAPLRFNRALVFQEVGLLEEAAEEWRAFLALRPSAGWAREAEAALAKLDSMASPEARQADLQVALEENRAGQLRLLAREGPQDAFAFAQQNLLEAWARAAVAGEERRADDLLDQTVELGGALEAATGDAFVQVLAEHLLGLSGVDRRRLAGAYLEYLKGRGLYDARRIAEAERTLAGARASAAGLGAPLEPWIDHYLYLCDYWQADPRAASHLAALGRSAAARQYSILAGYTAWTVGLIHVEAGRFSAGLEAYRGARRRFRETGMGEEAAAVSVLVSDALLRLGDVREAWAETHRAISRAQDYRKARNLWAAWDQAGLLSIHLGRPEVAPYFYEAALRAAEESGEPLTISHALVERAKSWTRLGLRPEARRDLRQAQRWGSRVTDPSSRLRAEVAIQAAGARLVEAGAEAEGVRRLTGAIGRYRRMGAEVVLPRLLLERARLLVADGDLHAAEADLRDALAILEGERRAIDELEWRVSFSNVARETIDALIRFHLEVARDPEALPALTDLARDPAYFAPLSPVAPADLLRADYRTMLELLPGEALLSVTVLENRLVLWVLREGGLSVVAEPVAPGELDRRLAAARTSPSREDLAWFYDRIVRPVAAHIEGVDHLFLALDRGLNLLPAGALYDRRSGDHLIDRTAVTLVPAALVLARPADGREVPVERVAIVGAPSGEGLPRLPEIQGEAATVGSFYPERRIDLDRLDIEGLEAAGAWADVLQFSGHAISNPLVPGLSRLVSGDEPIYAKDVRTLDLGRARTVILAACETAATTPEDSSGVLSLAVAFLEAGPDWVVASLWPIDDRAARRFMERFHRELRSDPRPDRALRRTQLHFLHSGAPPAEWAGYQVIYG